MAIIGVQLVLTVVMLSFLHRLSSNFSFARRLLSSRLFRYLHPSDEQLRQLSGLKPQHQSKSSNNQNEKHHRRRRDSNHHKDGKETNGQFLVPKNTDLHLEVTGVHPNELIQLHFYPEYQWLVDFSFCSVIVYFFTEIYYLFVPNSSEFNLSLVWCLLVICFTLKMLMSLTSLYFKGGDEAIGERSMCITAGCLFFLVSMIVMITDENLLEFGLQDAYQSFNKSSYELIKFYNKTDTYFGPTSMLMFKFWLALWCGAIGTFLIFPGLRFAQMHRDAVKYSEGNRVTTLLLNTSFISPLFIVLLWVRPLARGYLTEKTWSHRGVIMSSEMFETTRFLFIISVIVLRFGLIKYYLQAYLNLAPSRVANMKKEAGRIQNVELQKLVARVFYYLCVVALQFITPLLLCLNSVLLMKTLGGYSWLHGPIDPNPVVFNEKTEFSLSVLRTIFTPVVFRGVLGFMTWWTAAVWFTTSCVGFVYHTTFS